MSDEPNILDKIYQELSCLSTTIKTIRRNSSNKKFESEVYVLNRFISPGDICFDIGAAYGRYAYHFSPLVGDQGKVYCFEPGDYSYKVLTRVVSFHGLKNVIKVKKALSDRVTTAELTIPFKKKKKIGPSLAHLSFEESKEQGVHQQNVEVSTLDNFVKENNIGKIAFIKCDVEGAEFLVFKGGMETIKKYKPVILSEIDKEFLKKNNTSSQEYFQFFKNIGYRIFILKDVRFNEVQEFKENHNYFFIPAESEIIDKIQ